MTKYCVPFALSIITNKPYDDIVRLLQNSVVGDQAVEGIWMPSVINVLKSLNFKINVMKASGTYTLSSFKGMKGMFLCEIKGHAVVIRNGVMYDNSHPNGSEPTRHRVLRAYEVVKDASLV